MTGLFTLFIGVTTLAGTVLAEPAYGLCQREKIRDTTAVQLLIRANDKLKRATSLHATGAIDRQRPNAGPQHATFRIDMARPNLLSMDMIWDSGSGRSQPAHVRMLAGLTDTYVKRDAEFLLASDPGEAMFGSEPSSLFELPHPLAAFFVGATPAGHLPGVSGRYGVWTIGRLREPTLGTIQYIGHEQWKGATYQVVEWSYEVGWYATEDQSYYTSRVYIGVDTLIHRVRTVMHRGTSLDTLLVDDQYLISLVLDQALDSTRYMTPVEDLSLIVRAKNNRPGPWSEKLIKTSLNDSASAYRPVAYDLRIGSIPEIRVQTIQGPLFVLSDVLRNTRAVVLYNWFYNCGPCHQKIALLQGLRNEYRERGIEVVAISTMEDTPGLFPPDSSSVARELKKLVDMVRLHHITMPMGVSPPGSIFNYSYRLSNSSCLIIDSRSARAIFQEHCEPSMVEIRRTLDALLSDRPLEKYFEGVR